MSHKPLYAKKRHRWWLWVLIVGVLLLGVWRYYFVFDPQKIIDNSELKDRTFATEVIEITAPKSGIKAYLMPEKSNPIVSMKFIFANSGSVRDVKKGTANFVASMLTEGTESLNSHNFKEKLEEYAISIEYGAGKDDFSGSLLTLKENLPLATKLLHETLFASRMEVEDFVRVKGQILRNLEYLREKPQYRLHKAVRKEIFGMHPYAYNVSGTTESVKTIEISDLRAFINDNFVKNSLYIGIAGDITKEKAETLIDDVFAGLPEKSEVLEIDSPEIDYSARNINIEDETLPQVLSAIVAPSVSRLDRDFYPLYVANYVFGGAGLNSRVNQAAREKEGLTYGAYTSMSLLKRAPQLVGGFSTTPANFARMKEIFANEWQKMGNEGISKNELAAAKNYLINSYNLRFADIGTLAAILASMQREELGKDFLQKRNLYIERITLDRVNRAAKEYFSPEKLIMINMGNMKGNNDE